MEKILIIGSGGREHALAKAFEKSAAVSVVYVAPGNPGMELETQKIICVPIGATDSEALVVFAQDRQITYTVVGPETSLEAGVVDQFRAQGLKIVGPTKETAQIESSKIFAKNLMKQAGIPTATFQTFRHNQLEEAEAFVAALPLPVVIKENGLAAGKGVFICESYTAAYEALLETIIKKQADIVIEEYLAGPEFSHFSLINGEHIIPLGIARDYKRALDGEKGLNTGGMGAISLMSSEGSEISDMITKTIICPLIAEMSQSGMSYTGILYTGVMQTKAGLKVIEFNARFGDPETQVLLPLIKTDWVDILESHFAKTAIQLDYVNKQSMGVMVAAKGYPEAYEEGFVLQIPPCSEETSVYYSGVANDKNQLVAAGGRLFMATTQADNLDLCRQQVYSWLEQFESVDTFYRRDIGVSNTVKKEKILNGE